MAAKQWLPGKEARNDVQVDSCAERCFRRHGPLLDVWGNAKSWLMVALGGALGAMARYWMYNAHPDWQQKAALVTFMVNAIGSCLIGAAFVVLIEKGGLSPQWRNLVTVGFLGAFTTYSTYSLDALRMLEQGQFAYAALYLFGTLLVCLLAVWLGMSLTRLIV